MQFAIKILNWKHTLLKITKYKWLIHTKNSLKHEHFYTHNEEKIYNYVYLFIYIYMINVTLMGFISFFMMFSLRWRLGFLPRYSTGSRLLLVGVSELGFWNIVDEYSLDYWNKIMLQVELEIQINRLSLNKNEIASWVEKNKHKLSWVWSK